MLHFMILGFQPEYSNFGISKGQEIMQKRQPMHLSPSQVTGPSFVFSIAFTRHAAAQAGCQQCRHCFFTNTSPFSVVKRFTTVNCFSLVSRIPSSALSPVMSG